MTKSSICGACAPAERSSVAQGLRPSPKCSLDQLPTDVHKLLLEAMHGMSGGNQQPRQQPVLRLLSLHRMRSSLHAALYFEAFLSHYADIVREVDVLYPAHNWDILEYQEHAFHSPILLRTIVRSSASNLTSLRLPLYDSAGTETVLSTVLEECNQLQTLAFDDNGRVDQHMGERLAASAIMDLAVNRPCIHTVRAFRNGFQSLRSVRLHAMDRQLINHLRCLLKSSCLTRLENLSLEVSEQSGVVTGNSGEQDPGGQSHESPCDVIAFITEMEACLAGWLPSLYSLKLSWKSTNQGRRKVSQLRKADLSIMDSMVASIIASRASSANESSQWVHDRLRSIHLSTTSSLQLQRMKNALQCACRVADVRLDMNKYGVLVPVKPIQAPGGSAREYIVSKVNVRPVVITRVFGNSESPDERYRVYNCLEEVYIHLDGIMVQYSAPLWALWNNCGKGVRKVSVRCCSAREGEDTGVETEEADGDEQTRREQVDRMILHIALAMKKLKVVELSLCALTGAGSNGTVVQPWMSSAFRLGSLTEVRHVYVVACNCERAQGGFIQHCANIVAIVCRLPSVESVHVVRGGNLSTENISVAQLDKALLEVNEVKENFKEVWLGGITVALKEWRNCVRHATSTAGNGGTANVSPPTTDC